jgi:hypothetical protein
MILCRLGDLCKSLEPNTHTYTQQQKDPVCTIRDIETKKVFLTEIFSIISNLTFYIQRGQGAGFEIADMAR